MSVVNAVDAATVSCFSGLHRHCQLFQRFVPLLLVVSVVCTATAMQRFCPFQVDTVAAVVCAADCAAAGCHQPHCWQLDLVPC